MVCGGVQYITLSGGSTMFKHFVNRLQRDVKKYCDDRYNETKKRFPTLDVKKVEAKVITHPFQRFAVWFGGSMLASQVCVYPPTCCVCVASLVTHSSLICCVCVCVCGGTAIA